jgi:hypothetical protein
MSRIKRVTVTIEMEDGEPRTFVLDNVEAVEVTDQRRDVLGQQVNADPKALVPAEMRVAVTYRRRPSLMEADTELRPDLAEAVREFERLRDQHRAHMDEVRRKLT